MKNAKRIIALLLAVVMMIGILPFASAANVGPFTDVEEDDWYGEFVAYVYEYGLMNGLSKTTFGPNETCTRAMAATVLYRIEGSPAVAEPATFTDLDLKADWYLDPVAWAEDEGVVNGVGNGKFDPDGLVTREQLVTMIWRYAGSPEPTVDGGIDKFPDAKSVSDYAVKAFNWAIAKGIIDGKDDKLVPAGNATRAEFAKIISVYDKTNQPCETHTWVDGEVIKEATCTEAGEMATICSVCGEKGTKEIPALGHDYVDGVCSRCGDKLAEDGEGVIYFTNDTHTYIDKALSYATIAELKNQTAKIADGVLVVDAGDHAQGTIYGGWDKGQTIIELMNAAGYDYATLGNHEFDYGMDGAMNIIKWADHEYLSANFYHEEAGVRGENVLKSYAIEEMAGKKVAIIGITTPESFTKSTPAYFQDENGNYIYGIAGGEDGAALYADVQAAIDAAKAEGAEIIIALGHLGDDPASDPWNSEDVISNTTGLNAFIDGHSHSTVEGKEVADKAGNKVILASTGEYFDSIGKMTIKADGTISVELITDCALADASVAADIYEWITEIDAATGTPIAKSEVDFRINVVTGTDAEGKDIVERLIRKQETNLGDFCADALYFLFDNMDMDVDVAIMNGGGIRANMPAGDISYKTTKTVHTFGNVACLQTITGQQLLDALEWGAKDVGVGENGGFLQVSGITYEIHSYIPSTVQKDDKGVWCGAPTGEYRVKNVMVGGEPLDVNAKYNLAGYNYTLRDLGDGFAMFDGAVNVLDYVMEDYLVLANYAESFPEKTIKADNSVLGANYGDVNGEGRIVIKTEKEKTNKYKLDTALENGEEVVIYNAGSGKAMAATMNGYNLLGVEVAPADHTITTDDASLVWTVEKAADGTIKFVNGDYVLKCGVDGIYSNLYLEGDYADGWKLVQCNASNASFYIQSTTATTEYGPVYVEWYDAKGGFTAYGTSESRLTEAAFGFQFYTPNGDYTPPILEEKVFQKVTEDLGNWEGTYVIGWDDGTNAYIFDGQNDAANNNTQVAIADGKVTVSSTHSIIIEAVEGGYTLKATAGYLNGALKNGVVGNELAFEADPAVATIVWTDGNPIITATAFGTIFRFNNNSYDGAEPSYWFRFFTPGSSVQTPVNLYKLTDDAACEHVWDAGVVTTEATCTTEGEMTFTCTKCRITKTEVIAMLDHTIGENGTCSVCGYDPNATKYVAIYNVANGMAMTNEISVYNTKDQLKAAAATVKNGKLESTATNIVTFKIETNVDGITSFITEDGKYLYADGTHVRLADEGGDYTEFILDEFEGGKLIRLANYLHEGQYAQYIEYYMNVFTSYGMKEGADSKPFVVAFYELAEQAKPCEHVWDEGVTTDPTCTEDGKTVYTCTLCGETVTEPIAALGHNFVDGICSVCGAEETVVEDGAFVLSTELKDGDEVVIYYPVESLVMTYEINDRSRVVGTSATVSENILTVPEGAVVFTVEYVDATNFLLKADDGSYLYTGEGGNSMGYTQDTGACSQWYLKAIDGTSKFYIYSVGANHQGNYNQAMEVYYSAFTTYGQKDTEIYQFELYVKTNSDDVTPPCAHEWDEGEVTTEPDCTTDGEKTYNCTKCDATKTEVIAALGHVDADANNECDNCGTVLGGDLTEVAFSNLKDGDTIMIVMHTAADMTNKDFVLLNNYGTTSKDNAVEFTGEHNETMYFTVNIAEDGTVTLTAGDKNVYCTASGNNGLCCASSEAGAISFDESIGYLTIVDQAGNVRYIGVYDNNGGDMSKVMVPNFRAYKMKDDGTIANIGGQTLTIYKIG
ncbi:MAG: hypothetical protein E7467_01015 [Ruminococcaceae bacterium]|nr:hypothetical protein [Oscillospiraceae bacterium]